MFLWGVLGMSNPHYWEKMKELDFYGFLVATERAKNSEGLR